MRSKEESEDATFLVFACGADWYAVPADKAYEIVTWQDLTRLPSAASHVRGVFAHRGEVMPVIDLCALRSGTNAETQRGIVVRCGKGVYVLTATNVAGVTPLKAPRTQLGESGLSAQLYGPAQALDREVSVVDVEGLMQLLSSFGRS